MTNRKSSKSLPHSLLIIFLNIILVIIISFILIILTVLDISIVIIILISILLISLSLSSSCPHVIRIILIFILFCSEKGSSGHGILEFNTNKAGQDVTPLNLEFDEPKQRSSTFNSITGKTLGTFL